MKLKTFINKLNMKLNSFINQLNMKLISFINQMPQDEKKQQKAMNSFYEKAAKKNERKIRLFYNAFPIFTNFLPMFTNV